MVLYNSAQNLSKLFMIKRLEREVKYSYLKHREAYELGFFGLILTFVLSLVFLIILVSLVVKI